MSHTDCVIEGQNRRVANGSSWTDSDDDCVTCTCNVSLTEMITLLLQCYNSWWYYLHTIFQIMVELFIQVEELWKNKAKWQYFKKLQVKGLWKRLLLSDLKEDTKRRVWPKDLKQCSSSSAVSISQTRVGQCKALKTVSANRKRLHSYDVHILKKTWLHNICHLCGQVRISNYA